jgi:small-conductance mechanosensitive channel
LTLHAISARFGLGDPAWLDPVTAAVIVVIAMLVALVFHKLVVPLAVRLTHWTPTNLDTQIVRAVRWPISLGIVIFGVYLALTLTLDLTATEQDRVDTVARALAIIVVIFLIVGLVSRALDWYLENLAGRTTHVIDVRFFPLLRRATVGIIYGIGALLILDVLKINISPLIAGLGLGGLAVALAIQPTLANLFAGTYVMTEGAISTGDYIELEGGIAGYVVAVGWRSTRIRTWGNNLVVIPNARFAETIITNYAEPILSVNVYLTCGVSYDSDLDQVERVSREVMERLLESDPNAVKEYGAWFAFDSFGDSNVNFWLFLQAKDRLASFDLQSELVRGLHRRFREEGIVINYPVRALQFPEGWGPEDLAGQDGGQPGQSAGRRLRARRNTGVSEDAGQGPDIGGEPPGGGDGPDGPGGPS